MVPSLTITESFPMYATVQLWPHKATQTSIQNSTASGFTACEDAEHRPRKFMEASPSLYLSLNGIKGHYWKVPCPCLGFQQDSCLTSVREMLCFTCSSSPWSLLQTLKWLPRVSACRPDSNLAAYKKLCMEENTLKIHLSKPRERDNKSKKQISFKHCESTIPETLFSL